MSVSTAGATFGARRFTTLERCHACQNGRACICCGSPPRLMPATICATVPSFEAHEEVSGLRAEERETSACVSKEHAQDSARGAGGAHSTRTVTARTPHRTERPRSSVPDDLRCGHRAAAAALAHSTGVSEGDKHTASKATMKKGHRASRVTAPREDDAWVLEAVATSNDSLMHSAFWEADFNENMIKRKLPSVDNVRPTRRGRSATGDDESASSKGLRTLSLMLARKLRARGKIPCADAADELALEMSDDGPALGSLLSVGQRAMDLPGYDKNVRRRVYDALNVLVAVGAIVKDGKYIEWHGMDTSRSGFTSHECVATRMRVEEKRTRVKGLQAIRRSFTRLHRRNESRAADGEAHTRGNVNGDAALSTRVYCPFALIRSPADTDIALDVTENGSRLQFSFDRRFRIVTDAELVRRMFPSVFVSSPASKAAALKSPPHSIATRSSPNAASKSPNKRRPTRRSVFKLSSLRSSEPSLSSPIAKGESVFAGVHFGRDDAPQCDRRNGEQRPNPRVHNGDTSPPPSPATATVFAKAERNFDAADTAILSALSRDVPLAGGPFGVPLEPLLRADL